MTKRKMPKELQIYRLRKSIRKELKEEYFDSNIDTEAEIMDNIDFEALVDETLEYRENYDTIIEFM